MKNTAIVVDNLTKIYKGASGDEIRAVDGISFEVEEAEVFGLLGPNGAGKTSTLEILEGLRVPTSGHAQVLGMEIGPNGVTDRARLTASIGVQLQESAYFEELSLVETLKLLGSFYPRSKDARELLATVNLLDKASSRYGQLSGGQARRFSIAAALVNDPKVLFLDEPTTGLDPQARRNLWELIEEIKCSQRVTVVLTTHYMEEAEILCDRVGIIDGGKVVALDAPRTLISSLGGSYAASVAATGIDTESVDAILQDCGVEGRINEDLAESERAVVHLDFVSPSPASVFKVLDRLAAFGAEISDLSVRNASLEDVFLTLTGKALRD